MFAFISTVYKYWISIKYKRFKYFLQAGEGDLLQILAHGGLPLSRLLGRLFLTMMMVMMVMVMMMTMMIMVNQILLVFIVQKVPIFRPSEGSIKSSLGNACSSKRSDIPTQVEGHQIRSNQIIHIIPIFSPRLGSMGRRSYLLAPGSSPTL